MKIVFVVSENFLPLIQKAVDGLWPGIQAEYLLYSDYKECPGLIRGRQTQWDGIIFAGKAPCFYCEKYLRPEVPWTYFPGESGTLMRALLVASGQGWDLTRLSMDSYDLDMIAGSYEDIGLDAGAVRDLLYLGDVTDMSHNARAINFHLHNLEANKATACVTRLYTVWRELKRERVPVVFAGPTQSSIHEQISFLRRLHDLQSAGASRFTVFLISIDYPAEYTLSLIGEYQCAAERLRLGARIYRYAESVGATALEISSREYIIFSEQPHIQWEAGGLARLELLDTLADSASLTIHIGVGCGETLPAAKELAIKARLRSQKEPGSSAYCLLANGVGQRILPERKIVSRVEMDERLLRVARRSGVSLQTVYRIYAFVTDRGNELFTARELAANMGVSVRSANRLIEKLEEARFVKVSGQAPTAEKGRPSRLLLFDPEGAAS